MNENDLFSLCKSQARLQEGISSSTQSVMDDAVVDFTQMLSGGTSLTIGIFFFSHVGEK